MALLDLARTCEVQVVVVHVNYRRRPSAQLDADRVIHYCNQHQLTLELVNAPRFCVGNFQKRARDFRLASFRQASKRHKAQGVLLAHHQDDALETYLFQRERNSLVDVYGLKTSVQLRGLRIDRPLLESTKAELVAYCNAHKISYGVDESNESTLYTRTHYRKRIQSLSASQRKQLHQEMHQKNTERFAWRQHFQAEFLRSSLSLETLRSAQREWPEFWPLWLRHRSAWPDLSTAHATELLRQVLSSQNMHVSLPSKARLVVQYGQISVVHPVRRTQLTLFPDQKRRLNGVTLAHQPHSSRYCVCIDVDDYPVAVVVAEAGLARLSVQQQRRLRRAWIKHKMTYVERASWPLFFSVDGRFLGDALNRDLGCFKTDKNKVYVIR
jgi:tRNA(Ile)-lysidine synthetase-like protein